MSGKYYGKEMKLSQKSVCFEAIFKGNSTIFKSWDLSFRNFASS